MAIAAKMGTLVGPYPASDRGRAHLDANFAGCAVAAVVLVAWSGVSQAQTPGAATQAAPTAQDQPAPVAGAASESDGLKDLDAMTFSCSKAALNAAAREAAKAPAQGTYQFSYFKIISDSHDAAYEVHFKSNYVEEPDLKYCVSIYCQQGWDPETTKALITLMGNEPQRAEAAAHGAGCGDEYTPAQREPQ